MIGIHSTYNKERLEKLSGMFDGDPRRGNMALYVREHFDLKRICERCGKRTTANFFAVASVIVEGPAWVLPISLRHDGRIEIDLQTSIPNQSNFLSEQTTDALLELGITFTRDQVEYVIPVMPERAVHYRTIPKSEHQACKNVQEHLTCRVITDASAYDVLTWDTELEYDYETYCETSGEGHTNGYNVRTEYFQWLAEQGQLVIARISDKHDRTFGIAYCVPEQYELCLVSYKRRLAEPHETHGVGSALLFTLVDYIYDKELMTPLKLGPMLDPCMDIWHPIPVVKQRLEISNRVSRQTILDCFGSR